MSQKRKKKSRPARPNSRPRTALSPRQAARFEAAERARQAGDLAAAEAGYRGLLQDGARSPAVLSQLALVLAQTGRRAQASPLWKQAVALDPGYPDALMNLAWDYRLSGEPERALACYRRVLRREPGLFMARYQMANLLKAEGRMDEAEESYRRVVAAQPAYAEAHFSLAGIHRYRDPDDPHLAQMRTLAARADLPPPSRIYLAFALAKAYEDLGDHARAFEYLATGNRLRAATFDYDIESDRELIENIIETFTPAAVAAVGDRGADSRRPVFIVGMPRSGTSLVEKILASHSAVFAGEELEDFYGLVAGEFLNPARRYLFDPLSSYAAGRFDRLGADYLERLAALDANAARVTDKLPFNMLMIGMIRLALPKATIIHCVRDARDTCLSLYKQNFATDNYRFAYDLGTLAAFHNQYRRLMRHWHAVFPGAIHDVSYEQLTRDPEPEIRRLLALCGLDWEDACLEFHRSPGRVTTASAWQVRQPMYTSSVRLWQKYGTALQPLLDRLDPED